MKYKPIGKISLPEEGCYYGTEGYNGPSIYVDKINLFTGFLWYVQLSWQSLKDGRLIDIYDKRCITSISNFSRSTWIQWEKTN